MNIFVELLKAFLPGRDGVVFMWILAGVAVMALGVVIERWLDIRRRTNVDADAFSAKVRALIQARKFDEVNRICSSSGRRALPRILGAGVRKANDPPEIIVSAMEEETLHLIPALEKRVDLILMLGNVATLLGLMGTIFGLILSFAAVARPDVEAVEKSSLLASGISTAMNTTLLGLMISVPCVLIFSMLRARIDGAVAEIDRYAASVLKVLLPYGSVLTGYKVSARRIKEEVDTEPNIAPMMNLMVILIPLLLSSAEFVKIGAIELKLPESSGAGAAGSPEEKKEAKLDLGIVVTKRGFDLYHYYKQAPREEDPENENLSEKPVDVPNVSGEYDYEGLNRKLAEVKRKVLYDIIREAFPTVPQDATLTQLYSHYLKNDLSRITVFQDHEAVKIVAEDRIKYRTIVEVMDAARGTGTQHLKVTMFPNVSLAGGVVQ